jgi:hypothetical protein
MMRMVAPVDDYRIMNVEIPENPTIYEFQLGLIQRAAPPKISIIGPGRCSRPVFTADNSMAH